MTFRYRHVCTAFARLGYLREPICPPADLLANSELHVELELLIAKVRISNDSLVVEIRVFPGASKKKKSSKLGGNYVMRSLWDDYRTLCDTP